MTLVFHVPCAHFAISNVLWLRLGVNTYLYISVFAELNDCTKHRNMEI